MFRDPYSNTKRRSHKRNFSCCRIILYSCYLMYGPQNFGWTYVSLFAPIMFIDSEVCSQNCGLKYITYSAKIIILKCLNSISPFGIEIWFVYFANMDYEPILNKFKCFLQSLRNRYQLFRKRNNKGQC